MYIKSFSCDRFAGLKEIKMEFERGMNVILGPNESGKSTLVEGIYSTLFKGSRLDMRDKEDKEFRRRFMTHPDGDLIDGEIIISVEDKEYRIKKRWGSTELLRLVTPTGGIIQDPINVNKVLNEVFKYGPGTYDSVVFAKQKDLKKALNKILDSETSSEISNVLIKTMMELDGVSVDELEKKIQEKKVSLLKRWDLGRNYPVNNKGVNDPYKTGLGQVLEGYYHKERLRLSMDEVEKIEKDFEIICNKLNSKFEQINKLKIKKENLERIEDDITKRLILEPKIIDLKKEVDKIVGVCKKWPEIKVLAGQLNEKLEIITSGIKILKQEEENQRKIEEKVRITKRLQKIDTLAENIDNAKHKIKGVKDVTPENIKKLETYYNEIIKIKAAMEAGIIIGQFNRIKPSCNISLTTDLNNKRKINQGKVFTAKGYIKLESDEFELELKTGEMDYSRMKTSYDEYREKLKELLEKLQVENIEEAKLKKEASRKLINDIDSMEKQIKLLLGDDEYEALKEKLKGLGNLGQIRPMEEINSEMNKLTDKHTELRVEIKSIERTLAEWSQEYKGLDTAFELYGNKRSKLEKAIKELNDLAPIPKEFKTALEFKYNLAAIRKNYDKQQQEYNELMETYYEYQKNMPENTYEELASEYSEAETTFNNRLKKAEQIVKIQKVFEETKEEIGKIPFEPLAKKFTEYLSVLTKDRYNKVHIDEEFNMELLSQEGFSMPPELLSSGTYDCVALALRFSLLKYIYETSRGYVILDDCIVDLDPERRKMAVTLIKEYSENNQVIFTTCNPEIAELLGGNILKL